MTGFYMKCKTILKWVKLVFHLLNFNIYLPKHEQILKAFKRYSVKNKSTMKILKSSKVVSKTTYMNLQIVFTLIAALSK